MTKIRNLNIKIVTDDTRPIFKQIMDAVRMQIMQGKLVVGDKLPSVRGLAMQLTINVNTVAKAYSALTVQGVLQSRPGLGLFVAEPRQLLSERERYIRLNKAVKTLINDVAHLDLSTTEILNLVSEELSKIEQNVDGNDSQSHQKTGS
ncbi:MAG: GntR family transcriptional regulator [Hyphomicrobiales bacterium]